jgi:hypothetical protein
MNKSNYADIFPGIATFALATVLAITANPATAATIKCWTNKEGIKECGATVPPEFAQQGHEELNKQGIVVNVQERAKTDAELAEAKHQKDLAAKERKQKEAEQRKDQILLSTFAKVEDIEAAGDDKILTIEASISLAEKRKGKIEADLNSRIKAAANEERQGKTPNEALLKDIESLQRQASENEEYIAEQQRQIEEARSAYAADVERFKKLKSIE